MKKLYFFYLLSAAVVLFAGCSKSGNVNNDTATENVFDTESTVPDSETENLLDSESTVSDTETDSTSDTENDTETDITGTDSTIDFPLHIKIIGDAVTDPDYKNDGSTGQTPKNYYLGIRQIDLMTSESDLSPVTIFDAGADNFKEVDMLAENDFCTVDLADLPDATYTYAKILIASARFTIDITGHAELPFVGRQDAPGTADVVAAISDTTIDDQARNSGWMEYTFNLSGYTVPPQTGTLPEFTAGDTGSMITDGGQTWLLMNFGNNTTIVPSLAKSYTATMTMQVKDSFRWTDTTTFSDYSINVLDAESDGSIEPITSVGPATYSIVIN
ncbi:MAG: hypothetical protein JXR91_04035 [Deltaproteobacteria bacterium]|nr:hypothetical protein [Deltaproteobacteria bacterium]